MKYFAQLGAGNKIITIIVVSDADAVTEESGISFLKTIFGEHSEWKQSGVESRGNAVIGETYSMTRDLFSSPPMSEGPLD